MATPLLCAETYLGHTMIRHAPLLTTYAFIGGILASAIWMANAALDLPVVHKSAKLDGACVRIVSLEGVHSCDVMPEKYLTQWVE